MKNKLEPFHKSIVRFIKNCDDRTLASIGKLIKTTEITENHNAIIKALRHRRHLAGLNGDDPGGVIASVLKQKEKFALKCPNCGSSNIRQRYNKGECWNCGGTYSIIYSMAK